MNEEHEFLALIMGDKLHQVMAKAFDESASNTTEQTRDIIASGYFDAVTEFMGGLTPELKTELRFISEMFGTAVVSCMEEAGETTTKEEFGASVDGWLNDITKYIKSRPAL